VKHELVIEFTIPSAVAGQKSSAQLKAPIKELLMRYGPIDEVKVVPGKDGDRKVQVVFVNRLLEKGTALKTALEKNEKPTLALFDSTFEVTKIEGIVSSKGGAHSGTSLLKSTKPPKQADRGRGRGGEGRGGESGRGGAGRGKDDKKAPGGKAGGKDDKKGGKDGKKDDKKKDDKKGGDKKDDKKGKK